LRTPESAQLCGLALLDRTRARMLHRGDPVGMDLGVIDANS
jgi:hypothetical protein